MVRGGGESIQALPAGGTASQRTGTNHTISSLIALYGLRSESTMPSWVRAYKKMIEDDISLIKRKGRTKQMEHRDIEIMTAMVNRMGPTSMEGDAWYGS
jgi:transposase